MNTPVKKRAEVFKKSVSPDLNNVYIESYNSLGLKIVINNIHQYTKIEVSSKILGKDCINLISKENISIIYNKINQLIDVSYQDILDSQPNYCECTTDIQVQNYSETIEALYSLAMVQTRFKPSPKIRKRNKMKSSFWMKKNVVSNDIMEYICIYNKLNELTDRRKPNNINFLESLDIIDGNEVLEYFKDKLRIESKFQSKKAVRTAFDFNTDFSLKELLNSEKNVNYNMLEKIYAPVLTDCYLTKKMKPREFDQLNTLKLFNNDINAIVAAKSNAGYTRSQSKVKKEYRDVLSRFVKMNCQENIIEIKKIIEKTKLK